MLKSREINLKQTVVSQNKTNIRPTQGETNTISIGSDLTGSFKIVNNFWLMKRVLFDLICKLKFEHRSTPQNLTQTYASNNIHLTMLFFFN